MIKVDYNELVQTLRKGEICKVALGSGKGENKVQSAISEVLSYNDICRASRALVFIKGSRDLSLEQTQELLEKLQGSLSGCEIKIAVELIDELDDEIQVAVVAAGFKNDKKAEG